MERTKMKTSARKSCEPRGWPTFTEETDFLQLDIGNLPSKSLSSLIEGQKRGQSKTVETQTDFDSEEISFQVSAIQQKYEIETATLEKKLTEEFTREKNDLGTKLTKHYQAIIEEQNEAIKNLKEEKDFLWEEIRYFRENLPIFEESSSSTSELDWDPEGDQDNIKFPGKVSKPKDKTIPPMDVQEKEFVLCTLMSLRKQALIQNYKRDKQAILDRNEIEKDLIRDEITTELEIRYSEEISGLHDVIDGLKEALQDMKEQKNQLAKIFQGERNALELQNSRKEQEIKDKMTRDLQRELVKAHKEWTNSKI